MLTKLTKLYMCVAIERDQNSVSVKGIGIDIGAEFFFAETETFFFKFYSFFPTSWGNTSFYKQK